MTPKQEAALRQALDCVSTLANARDWVGCTPNERWDEDEMYAELCNATICLKKSLSIIQEALPEQSAQQQEPVAWMDGYRNIYSLEEKAAGCPEATIALVPMANQEKTSGSPINELQCVCGAVWLGEEMVHLPDKRPPASKPWVGLTQQDIDIAFDDTQEGGGFDDFARAIEAKLREKNA